ncbi:MAG: FtsB family cell division protein [Canibacter sp.]
MTKKNQTTQGNSRASLAEALSGLRFGGFTVMLLALIIVGVAILSPSVTTFVQQRREIHDLKQSIAESQAGVDQAEADRKRWEDPAFIRAQARDRLFYVLPGESQLGVINDITLPPEEQEEAQAGLTKIDRDWTDSLISSVIQSGTLEPETEQ